MQGFIWIKIRTIHNNSYVVQPMHIVKLKALENE